MPPGYPTTIIVVTEFAGGKDYRTLMGGRRMHDLVSAGTTLRSTDWPRAPAHAACAALSWYTCVGVEETDPLRVHWRPSKAARGRARMRLRRRLLRVCLRGSRRRCVPEEAALSEVLRVPSPVALNI